MKVFAIILALVAGGWLVWQINFPSATVRYRMTVAVETPEGVKTGSAVREVYMRRDPQILPEQHAGVAEVKGEAVVVDLGKRGVLFALPSDSSAGSVLFEAFPSWPVAPLTAEGIRFYKALPTGTRAELKLNQYPMFVRFRDLNDPKSVEVVSLHPADGKPESSFESAFGAGVHLKSVTVEMTTDSVTIGTVKRFAPTYEPIDNFVQWLTTLKFDDPRRFGPDALMKGGSP